MKYLFNRKSKIIFTIASIFAGVATLAQSKKLDIDININKKPEWYQEPWLLGAGAIVLVLLIIAALRRRK
jgi:hypothetical protein